MAVNDPPSPAADISKAETESLPTAEGSEHRSRVRGRCHRLVTSQFPPIGVFESVASPDDALAAMTLEGLTNDRLQLPLRRAGLLPREEWIVNEPGATAVMAAFLHAAPDGGRFSSGELGAWYSARTRETAISETVHHQRRRLQASPSMSMVASITMREWVHTLDATLVDLRGMQSSRPSLYARDSYAGSQPFGEAIRATGATGIVYDSVRHPGGSCIVLYKPRAALPLRQGVHLEYRWNGSHDPTVVLLEQLR